MKYTVTIDRRATRMLDRLPRGIQRRILTAVKALATDPRPHGVVKLTGSANEWRIRVGDYRVIYEIHDDRLLVLVVSAAHRREAYRG